MQHLNLPKLGAPKVVGTFVAIMASMLIHCSRPTVKDRLIYIDLAQCGYHSPQYGHSPVKARTPSHEGSICRMHNPSLHLVAQPSQTPARHTSAQIKLCSVQYQVHTASLIFSLHKLQLHMLPLFAHRQQTAQWPALPNTAGMCRILTRTRPCKYLQPACGCSWKSFQGHNLTGILDIHTNTGHPTTQLHTSEATHHTTARRKASHTPDTPHGLEGHSHRNTALRHLQHATASQVLVLHHRATHNKAETRI